MSAPAEPVSIGDDHKTHAWTKWHSVAAGPFSSPTHQQRECVVCNFAQRVLISAVSR